ncbi:DUF4240 domain-containing protein [Kibdelosporangium lantanae]
MDTQEFWRLIETARDQAAEDVPSRASALLAIRPPAEIVAAQQVLWDLMVVSYQNPLWAAAYLINGGCSDDGFDYFRAWLIGQGRHVFERVLADPDSLADLPDIRAAAADGTDVESEDVLTIAWDAHIAATGAELPENSFTIRYPALDPDWDFDFDDRTEMRRRLPRLAALYLD